MPSYYFRSADLEWVTRGEYNNCCITEPAQSGVADGDDLR